MDRKVINVAFQTPKRRTLVEKGKGSAEGHPHTLSLELHSVSACSHVANGFDFHKKPFQRFARLSILQE
jgi:hypothetical protein